MSTNATVTMPIGELDSLRDELKKCEAEIKDYKERERSIIIKVSERTNITDYKTRNYGAHSRVEEVNSYKNLDDIMENLRETARVDVMKEVNQIKQNLTWAKNDYTYMQKKYEDLQEKFNALKADKDHKTLEEQVEQMKKDNEKLLKDVENGEREYNRKLQMWMDDADSRVKEIQRLKNRKWYKLW